MARNSMRSYLIARSVVAVVAGAGASAQTSPTMPDFSSNQTAWAGGIGVDFTAVPGSPAPNHQDPAHPFVPNGTGAQPTYRIADLAANTNLKQWAWGAARAP